MDTGDFAAVFDRLKAILCPFEERLLPKEDTEEASSLDTPYAERWKRELFFGAVKIEKSCASFHLMPVYMCPDLLDDLPGDLRKRMQGKSCFNFRRVDPELFRQLEELATSGSQRLEDEEMV